MLTASNIRRCIINDYNNQERDWLASNWSDLEAANGVDEPRASYVNIPLLIAIATACLQGGYYTTPSGIHSY